MRFKAWVEVTTIAVLATVACADPGTGSAGQPTPGLSSAISPESKAADLRTRLELLLGEHVMVVAKISLAAAGNRKDEYESYASLLTTNAADLKAVMSSAFGASAATRFASIWSIQNGNLVDYTNGSVSHNAKKSSAAASGLVNDFIPKLAQFIASSTPQQQSSTKADWTERTRLMRAMIDDQGPKNYKKMYADLRSASAITWRLGDALAKTIAQRFPDKFPGDPTNKGTDLRTSLNLLLHEHAYLATMTTGALAGARNAEQASAQGALAANAADLSAILGGQLGDAMATRFDQMWSAKDAELIIYSGSSDAGRRQNALGDLRNTFTSQFARFVHDSTGIAESSILSSTTSQVQATILVIDDQRSGSLAVVAAGDRTAAAAMEVIADSIAVGLVSKSPSRFA